MKTITIIVGAIFLTTSVSGCSLFGIATKGDLQKQVEASQSQDRQLQETLTKVHGELGEVGGSLAEIRGQLADETSARQSDLEQASAERLALIEQVDRLGQRVASVDDVIGTLDTALRTDLDGVRGDVTLVRGEVQRVESDLGSVRAETELANDRSVTALRTYYDRLLRDRQRLSIELEALERELTAWQEQGLLPATTAGKTTLP